MRRVILLQHESEAGRHDFRLTRLIQFAGFKPTDFEILKINDNYTHTLADNVLVPMGDVASSLLIGRGGILSTRGYVYPGPEGSYVIPTVSPGFIQRGQSRWSAPFIADLQKAVVLARDGMPPQFLDYTLDPSPLGAYKWALGYMEELQKHRGLYLAFDIETPGKGEDEEDVDLDNDAPDRTWFIHRIGFSFRGLQALSIPWEPTYIPAIKLLLGSEGPKVVWNAGFDVPRVKRAGIPIEGIIHDGMVAWHILHSDLPKKLGFVATFTCPWQPAWKHLSGAKPAFYNATDADVEWRSMECIERELRASGLWEVYQRDVLDLEPVLHHMQRAGMPISLDVRYDRAVRLAERLGECRERLQGQFPLETRKIDHVYVKTPADTTGLLSRPGNRVIPFCPGCGLERPRKDHFKTFVKKRNPCAGLLAENRTVEVVEYYRLSDFSPSRDQLIRYHNYLKRPLPLVWDKKAGKKKVSFNEASIKKLILTYPDDPVYNLILDYRGLDKIAGTYIGRPVDGNL